MHMLATACKSEAENDLLHVSILTRVVETSRQPMPLLTVTLINALSRCRLGHNGGNIFVGNDFALEKEATTILRAPLA